MNDITIRSVEIEDLPLLDSGLRALSKELGDTHAARIAFLEQAGFGPTPAYFGLIAFDPTGALCGAAAFSPVISTSLGVTGAFVSDLWVAEAARGQGVGRRLLAEASEVARAKWGARYLKLAVYDGSVESRKFYERLGFTARRGETTMFLDNKGLKTLRGET